MKDLKGRTAIVTGASRGIGVHIARSLSGAGMNMALVARSAQAIEQLARELSQVGTRVVAIAADLTDLRALEPLVDRAQAELGAIDVLINNAGIDGICFYPEETDAQTERMLRLDLLSPMLLTRKCLPAMLARKTGHIVNIASLAGKSSTPYNVSYSAAKAGLIGFTHSLRAELRGSGVSASVVCPGFIAGEGMFAVRERAHGVHVSRLLGTSSPEQVAEAVLQVLREDRVEVIVNPGPIRFIQALNQLAPATVAWVQARLLGVDGMLHTLALADRSQSPLDKAP
jgi:short-subunit dehydrogenase